MGVWEWNRDAGGGVSTGVELRRIKIIGPVVAIERRRKP